MDFRGLLMTEAKRSQAGRPIGVSFRAHMRQRVTSELFRISEESLISRLARRLSDPLGSLIDDRVGLLQHSPLGMFFYNMRFVLFVSGLLVLCLLPIIGLWSGQQDWKLVCLLGTGWSIASVTTILRHRRFRDELDRWAEAGRPNELPLLFDSYSKLDFVIVFLALVFGHFVLLVDASGLLLLLFGNVVVHAAYGGERRTSAILSALAVVFVIGAAIWLQAYLYPRSLAITWQTRFVYYGSCIGTLSFTVFSVKLIADLRRREDGLTRLRLDLLGEIEEQLRGGQRDLHHPGETSQSSEEDAGVLRSIEMALGHLCSTTDLWFRSATYWGAQSHKDAGVIVRRLVVAGRRDLIQSPSRSGVGASTLRRDIDIFPVPPRAPNEHPLLGSSDGSPAAVVPLVKDRTIGYITVHGASEKKPLSAQDSPFLASLGAIVASAVESGERGRSLRAQRALDDLLKVESLEGLFDAACSIMIRHLRAAGCMVLFRPDPVHPGMKIVATQGFRGDRLIDSYQVGLGNTGYCAASGRVVRVDDVRAHRHEFDATLLETLEAAIYEKPVRSWMAIPIGEAPQANYGVIKVINSKLPHGWFSDEDENLGRELANVLRLIISRQLSIKHADDARREAVRNAEAASVARLRAETEAKARQEDIMNVTHQLQGPLSSLIMGLSGIQSRLQSSWFQGEIGFLKDLADDSLTLAYGTFVSLAKDAGEDPSVDPIQVDVVTEVERLAERLKRTSGRSDLKFRYSNETGFPKITIDKNVLTSVVYSLIHNAMKYADEGSQVELECGFERRNARPALKVKSEGAIIQPHETTRIFEKFERGHLVKATGSYHRGVGLGLWVARSLIRSVGGDLVVELSTEDPTRSVFVVFFPEPNMGANTV